MEINGVMNNAIHKDKPGNEPAIYRFKALLIRHPKTAKTNSWGLLNIPKSVSKKLPPRGVTKVEGVMNGQPFRAALEPNGSGTHSLHVNQAMRKGAGADAGDLVTLIILEPDLAPKAPLDLRRPLAASAKAKAFWKELTPVNRCDWIRWIDLAKTPGTRERKIRLAVEWLSSGKRQPCCFNIYEFMHRRIYGDAASKSLYPGKPKQKVSTPKKSRAAVP